jgi:hypothetical protein
VRSSFSNTSEIWAPRATAADVPWPEELRACETAAAIVETGSQWRLVLGFDHRRAEHRCSGETPDVVSVFSKVHEAEQKRSGPAAHVQ